MSERAPGQKPKSTNMYVVRGKKASGAEVRAVADGKEKLRRKTENDRIDELFGFTRFTEVRSSFKESYWKFTHIILWCVLGIAPYWLVAKLYRNRK